MARILYGTTWVQEDEPCIHLVETNRQSPGSRGFHRYQEITVYRGGKFYVYSEDLGLAKKYKGVPLLNIPGGVVEGRMVFIEETVGRLREIALQLRDEKYDVKAMLRQDDFILK